MNLSGRHLDNRWQLKISNSQIGKKEAVLLDMWEIMKSMHFETPFSLELTLHEL